MTYKIFRGHVGVALFGFQGKIIGALGGAPAKHPGTWLSRYPGIWVPRHLGTQIPGCPGIWV